MSMSKIIDADTVDKAAFDVSFSNLSEWIYGSFVGAGVAEFYATIGSGRDYLLHADWQAEIDRVIADDDPNDPQTQTRLAWYQKFLAGDVSTALGDLDTIARGLMPFSRDTYIGFTAQPQIDAGTVPQVNTDIVPPEWSFAPLVQSGHVIGAISPTLMFGQDGAYGTDNTHTFNLWTLPTLYAHDPYSPLAGGYSGYGAQVPLEMVLSVGKATLLQLIEAGADAKGEGVLYDQLRSSFEGGIAVEQLFVDSLQFLSIQQDASSLWVGFAGSGDLAEVYRLGVTASYLSDAQAQLRQHAEALLQGQSQAAIDGYLRLAGSVGMVMEFGDTSHTSIAFQVVMQSAALDSHFNGSSGVDAFVGSGLNDTIDLGTGNDLGYGAGGNDRFIADASWGNWYIGGDGLDTVAYGITRAQATVTSQTQLGKQAIEVDRATAPGTHDMLSGVERLEFLDGRIALDIDGTNGAGAAYRIYQAAFDRTPDVGGLTFWTEQADKAMSTIEMAARFIDSNEFRTLYGSSNPPHEQFISLIYQNVLHRAPDQGGHDYWAGELAKGMSEAEMLARFADSAENRADVIGIISNGIWLNAAGDYG